MWAEGSLKVYNCVFHYWVKHYEEGSRFGIAGGRISKMMLKRGDEIVLNYDRGWDITASDPDTDLAKVILIHEYN